MKKMTILLLLLAAMLCGCMEPAAETQENGLRERLLLLPTVEELEAADPAAQREAYDGVQALYGEYQRLSPEEQAQIPEAQALFARLFDWFNGQVMPIKDAETSAPATEATEPPVLLDLSEEDRELLLKIGMAELGEAGCPECVALVMCTVLNRVESDRFGSTVRSVLYAQDQFTPVMDGSFAYAEPNGTCHEALDMVLRGWDESQGALFYEFCQGESWHSRNLTLLTQHCNTRFYA